MNNFESIKMEYTRETKQEALKKRKFNIKSFSELNREGLEFGVIERKLLLHQTGYGEKIFIQYPGKETKSNKDERIRPWDFRPKLEKSDGTYLKDLSFGEIWDDLSEMHEAGKDVLCVLAALFFRMALMVGYIKVNSTYDFITFNQLSNASYGTEKLEFEWYKMSIPMDILTYLDSKIGKINGVSVEAYLYYNDLLVQNEDCKYFYKDTYVKQVEWKNKVGRNNTMLSHISIIEYLQGSIKFSEIMNRFQRGMGVAPISLRRIPDVTNGIISR